MSNWVYECDIMDFKPSETGYVEVYIKSDCESLERKLEIAKEALEKACQGARELKNYLGGSPKEKDGHENHFVFTAKCNFELCENLCKEALEKIKGVVNEPQDSKNNR